MLKPPSIEPVRSLFRSTQNYRETLFFGPNDGKIQLGDDLSDRNLEGSLFWVNGILWIRIDVWPKSLTREEAVQRMVHRSMTTMTDENVSQRDVWVLARTMAHLLHGTYVEVTAIVSRKNGVTVYPILEFINEMGAGLCPQCKVLLPWKPAFPMKVPRRCPACATTMIRDGDLLCVAHRQ